MIPERRPFHKEIMHNSNVPEGNSGNGNRNSKRRYGNVLNKAVFNTLWQKLISGNESWDTIEIGSDGEIDILRGKEELCQSRPGNMPSLGPVLRFIMVRHFLTNQTELPGIGRGENSSSSFTSQLLRKYAPNPSEVQKLKISNFGRYNRQMTFDQSQGVNMNNPAWDQILGAMLKALDTHHRLTHYFTSDMLFDPDRFSGVNAVDEFMDTLEGKGALGHEPALEYIFSDDGKRHDALKSIIRFAREPIAPAKSLLATVSCNNSWRDGSAFAQKVEAELKKDGPLGADKVLRITLASYAQTETQNPKAEYVMPYDDVVKCLAEAFGIDLPPNPKTAPYYDLVPTIRAIRRKMATNPMIILFEGYYAEEKGSNEEELGAEILRIARDDHFKGLLLRLMEPSLVEPEKAGEYSSETFRQNRFIVISNRPLRYFEDETATGAYALTHETIEPPTQLEMTTILEQCELTYKETLSAALSERASALQGYLYEPIYDLLNKFLILKHGPTPSDYESEAALETLTDLLNDSTFPRGGDVNVCMPRLMSKYLDLLKSKSLEVYQLHLLLALLPDGLRQTTLLRIARRYSSLKSPDMADSGFKALTENARKIGSELAECFGTLITRRKVDLFHGLDESMPVFETNVLTDDETPEELSGAGYDIEDPIIKECLNRAILGDCEGVSARLSANQLRIAHRMLSEEALSQQTLGFRQRGIDYTPSFRSYRRLVSAIYHGMCSIPLQQKGGQVRISNGAKTQVICPYFSGSRDPKKFYSWNYVFLYRTIIERAPYWELSRRFALDRLKADFLEVFDSPWRLRNHPDNRSLGHLEGSLIEATFEKKRCEVVVDYLVNYSYAMSALVKPAKANEAAHRLRTLGQNREPQGRLLELKNRTIGMNADMQSEKIDIEGDWGRLWTSIHAPTTSARKWPLSDRTLPDQEENFSEVAKRLQCDIKELIEKNAGAYWKLFKDGAPLEEYEALPSVHSYASGLFRDVGSGDPAIVAEFTRNLFQLSDITAEEADLWRSIKTVESLGVSNIAVKRRIKDLRNKLGEPDFESFTQSPYAHFCRSLATYKLAEQLRMEIFHRDPLGGHFIHSGRAARANIRTCLVLEREARKVRLGKLKEHELIRGRHRLGLFSREARRTNDRVTKHLFRFPRERASLQIIEGSMHRMLSEVPSNIYHPEFKEKSKAFEQRALGISWRYLNSAENIVLGLSRKNSIRRHFSLERIKLHLALANASSELNIKKKHLNQAERNVKYLTAKAQETGTAIWIILAAMQERRIGSFQKLIN